MKFKKRKCPGCGRRVLYIEHDDGSGWLYTHKNRQGEKCDEKPKRHPMISKILSVFGRQSR